ncbi:MAG: 30S ribosomal protein S9 [Verrucomicrobiae bacterium]|nr:30S ribosomal protein S9 [Verrucomicrobiae bacterium]
MSSSQAFLGTGRRKTAVARVRLLPGAGNIKVNGSAFDDYFASEELQTHATEPLRIVGKQKDFDIQITVQGGGPNGQASAVRHAISRALLQVDANLRPALKEKGCLTRDPRMRERKKSGQPGARRRFQFSKR